MINFNYESDFELPNESQIGAWLSSVIVSENKTEGEISYIFCDDAYLHKINLEYLNHDTLTDIISFDYSLGNQIGGDIFISIERVRDNAFDFKTNFSDELLRVMVHGILHYCGYSDKTPGQEIQMRQIENNKMQMFHVKHI